MSGLSGNEMYCLNLKGLAPGDLVLGNSVYSMGFVGGLSAGLRSMVGGEVTKITEVIHEGRLQAIERMSKEAEEAGGYGISGVSSELKSFRGNIEFISVGTCVKRADGQASKLKFSTSGDGQELYCQLDAGFTPVKFAFGNVAYSIGIGGGIVGGLKSLGRGEIKEYSNVLNKTRHLAIERLEDEARQVKANAVIGIETTVMPFQGVHEMMMTGTAAKHPSLAEFADDPVTSDLTCEEMWNLVNIGFMPLKLVMGTA
ncbi:MAG TPA: heavy metal-binding domain-containing protein, partial [Gemmataceae bacterium]|nr:heavy metal-binding domain-containing protein [Gemmataceae bacterium]